MKREFEHIITQITEKERKRPKEIILGEVKDLSDSFSTVELYPISRLLVLFNYLSDLAVDNPLSPGEPLFESHEKSSKSGRIHTQLKVIERLLNLPEDVPCVVDGDTLIILNAYGYRSHHCKGRLYGQRNTMTLISRQCRYYLFRDLYFDVDLKNAHPSMLLFYAQSNNIKAPLLEEYVSNREEFLARITSKSEMSRNEAKVQVLRSINVLTDKYLPEELKPLLHEILPIREHLFNSNLRDKITELGEYCLTRESFNKRTLDQQKVSLQSHYCTTEESKCLDILREVCLQKGLLDREAKLSKESRNLSFIPFFDGAYISFNSLKRKVEVESIVADTNDLIAPYVFEVKDIKPEWDYIDEDDLKYYEKIQEYMPKLSAGRLEKLLDFLNIPPFRLNETKLSDIVRATQEEELLRNLKEEFQDGKNSDFISLVAESSKEFHYKIRREMLKAFKENRMREFQESLKKTGKNI